MLQLVFVEHDVKAEVIKDGKGDRAGDGDAVLGVAGELGIAADRCDSIDRDGDLDIPVAGIGGIARDGRAVGVGQSEQHPGRNITVGRGRTNVEATEFLFAALVEAIERGSYRAGNALDIGQLELVAKDVPPGRSEAEALYRMELLELHHGADVANVAPQTGNLEGGGEFAAVARLVRVVDLVF